MLRAAPGMRPTMLPRDTPLPRVGGEHEPTPARREHAPRLRVEVEAVELGQHRARYPLNVGNLDAGHGREDDHLDAG
jgi:hypothetical protein